MGRRGCVPLPFWVHSFRSCDVPEKSVSQSSNGRITVAKRWNVGSTPI